MANESLKDKINQFSALLVNEMPRINESVALNAYALVRDRIINDGTNGEGASLGSYSDNDLPLFFYTGKSLNAGGEAAVEKAKKDKKGLSYKEFRQANNRPTDHVTLNFSGQMWKDVGVIKQIVSGTKIVTVVGAKNTINRFSGKKSITTDDILEGNRDRYGDFLEVNDSEQTDLAKTYDSLLQKLIDKTFA